MGICCPDTERKSFPVSEVPGVLSITFWLCSRNYGVLSAGDRWVLEQNQLWYLCDRICTLTTGSFSGEENLSSSEVTLGGAGLAGGFLVSSRAALPFFLPLGIRLLLEKRSCARQR